MTFIEKSLTTLELPTVLGMLAAEAVSETAKEHALALRPSTEAAEVRRRLEETSAANAGKASWFGMLFTNKKLAA